MTEILNVFKTLYEQLYYSLVSNKEFFEFSVKKYKGYALKYVIFCFFLSSILPASFISYNLMEIRLYLEGEAGVGRSLFLDDLLKGVPELYYDGSKLTGDYEEPVLLSSKGANIVSVDVKNKLQYKEKLKIPLNFGSEKVFFGSGFGAFFGSGSEGFSLPYNKLFPQGSAKIDSETVRDYLKKTFSHTPEIAFVLFILIATLAGAFRFLWLNLFASSFLYFFCYFLKRKIEFQAIFRTLAFVQGFFILLEPAAEAADLPLIVLALECLAIWRYINLSLYLFKISY